MAALQCEICGGKLMGKPGGIFECDSCGMEYSTEWAKAKIQEIKGTVKVEGTVEVKGTVKLDGAVQVEGNATENSLLRRAKVLLEERKWNDAKDVVHQLLSINPECSQAYIYEYLLEYHIEREEDLAYIEPRYSAIEKWNTLFQRVSQEDRVRLENYRSSRTARLTQEAPPSRQLMEKRRQIELLQGCLGGGAWNGYWVAHSVSGKLHCLVVENDASWAKEVETWPDGVVQLLCEKDWIIAVYADGTCRAAANANPQLKHMVESWEDIKLVGCHAEHILLLTYDGELSSCQWKESEKEVKTYYRASGWQNVEKLTCRWDSNGKYVIGQTADGTLLSTFPLPADFPPTGIRSFSEFFEYWIKRDGSCFIKEREDSWPDQKDLRVYRVGLRAGLFGSAVITNGGTLVERWKNESIVWQREIPNVLDCVRYLDRINYVLHTDGTLLDFGKPICQDRKFVAILQGSRWYAAVDTDGYATVFRDRTEIPENTAISRWKLFDSAETMCQEYDAFMTQKEILREQATQRRLAEKIRRKAEAEKRREERIRVLQTEKVNLQREFTNLKGLFTGKRRKEIENRLTEIETELKGLV
ncbi:MAG: hypothetical protein IKK72_03195 [Oscillospiraceae bacterium]|nr:hypothetical protein [Oscillospiraceae bacterium]